VSADDPLDALGLSLRRGATELHVIRHADAIPEADGAHLAYEDYEGHSLSGRGRAQAEALAEHFAALDIAGIYASPIARALETAAPLAGRIGVPLIEDPDLREVDIGAMEGQMSLRERLHALAAIAMRDGSWDGIPGTERSELVRVRMLRSLDGIAARHPTQRVAVVSHAGAINAALGAIVETAHDFIFPLANASVSIVRINGTRRLLMSANETAHLSGIPSRARR
jgi:2,3-bisphosphoglycerate-dependent phosphoglycerate mutase